MFKKILIFLIIISSYVLAGTSLGVVPGILEVNFEPNLETSCNFMVKSSVEDVIGFKEGELSKYVEVPEEKMKVEPGQWTPMSCIIKFPDDIEPGVHEVFVGIKEYVPPGGMVGAVAKTKMLLLLRKPYPGKYLEGDFYTTHVNVNEDVSFTINLVNRGTESVNDVYADIDIFEGEEKIDSITTNHISIEKGGQLKAKWKTGQAGNYGAKAKIYYDGSSFELTNWFSVGELLIKIVNISDAEVKKGEIAKFEVRLKSFWNEVIGGVYGELVLSSEQLTKKGRTEALDLGAWSEETISGYLETDGLEIGEYDIDVKMYYSNKTVEGKTKLKIVKKSNFLVVVVLTVVILLVLVIIFFFTKRKKKK